MPNKYFGVEFLRTKSRFYPSQCLNSGMPLIDVREYMIFPLKILLHSSFNLFSIVHPDWSNQNVDLIIPQSLQILSFFTLFTWNNGKTFWGVLLPTYPVTSSPTIAPITTSVSTTVTYQFFTLALFTSTMRPLHIPQTHSPFHSPPGLVKSLPIFPIPTHSHILRKASSVLPEQVKSLLAVYPLFCTPSPFNYVYLPWQEQVYDARTCVWFCSPVEHPRTLCGTQ